MEFLKNLFQKLDRRPKVHFLHVGKSGGTAVKAALKPQLKRAPVAILFRPHHVSLREVPVGEKLFFFLRNPVTRFVSGFNSRLRMGRPRMNQPWTPEEKPVFEKYSTPDQLAQGLISADAAERTAAETAMRSIRHVRDVYRGWFASEEYLLSRLDDIVMIGFQESLDRDFATLKERLGLPADLQLPRDEISTHKTPAHLSQKLQASSVEILTRWYAEDFRYYDLCQKLVAEKKIGGKI